VGNVCRARFCYFFGGTKAACTQLTWPGDRRLSLVVACHLSLRGCLGNREEANAKPRARPRRCPLLRHWISSLTFAVVVPSSRNGPSRRGILRRRIRLASFPTTMSSLYLVRKRAHPCLQALAPLKKLPRTPQVSQSR
jgi:hypothetical protein